MTKKEVLKAKFGLPVKDAAVEAALLDDGIDGTADYTADNKQEIELCLANLIFLACIAPKSVSEGGFSYSVGERKDLLTLRSLILQRYGLNDDLGPTVSDASDQW